MILCIVILGMIWAKEVLKWEENASIVQKFVKGYESERKVEILAERQGAEREQCSYLRPHLSSSWHPRPSQKES